MAPKTVDVRRLKDFASQLPKDSALRELLLTERDELEVCDFLSKMSVWLRLFGARISSRESS